MHTREGRKNMFKHVIWDFDGTLFDSYPVIVKLFLDKLLENNINVEYGEVLKHFLISEKSAINHYTTLYNLDKNFEDDYKNGKKCFNFESITPYDYAEEVCAFINETGGSNYILTRRGESALTILKNNKMDHLFKEVITKERNFKRKPHGEAIEYLIFKYGLKKEEILIVGNRELEVLLGKNNGIKVCFFDSGNISLLEKADFYITSEIYEGFSPLPNEKIFDKNYNSAFNKTGLLEYLKKNGESEVIVVGLQTDYCIDGTIKCGFEHGFKMIVPSFANTTVDNDFMSGEKSYKYYNEFIWPKRYATCISMEETMLLMKRRIKV